MFEGRTLSTRPKPDSGKKKPDSKPESEFKFEAKRKMSTMVILTDFKKSADSAHLNIPSISEEVRGGFFNWGLCRWFAMCHFSKPTVFSLLHLFVLNVAWQNNLF